MPIVIQDCCPRDLYWIPFRGLLWLSATRRRRLEVTVKNLTNEENEHLIFYPRLVVCFSDAVHCPFWLKCRISVLWRFEGSQLSLLGLCCRYWQRNNQFKVNCWVVSISSSPFIPSRWIPFRVGDWIHSHIRISFVAWKTLLDNVFSLLNIFIFLCVDFPNYKFNSS